MTSWLTREEHRSCLLVLDGTELRYAAYVGQEVSKISRGFRLHGISEYACAFPDNVDV